ncbi:MAG TPA: MoaD/ThiS family protein [Propionibacteriaceae bacterium]|nr:MoaD/ThiS family protein [Propionibacteriaceae bacterium]
MAIVRFFAAAAEAAGTATEAVDAETLGELLMVIAAERDDRFDAVLERSSILVDGLRTADPVTPLAPDAVIDVLPPFAGG